MPLASNLSPAYPARAPRGAAEKLRAWQQAAVDEYLARQPRDFLTVATPGAGKTTYALRLASELLDRRVVERIVVVAPTEHLKTQWAEAAKKVGIPLDPEFSGARGTTSSDFLGIAVTYAGVAANTLLYRRRVEDRKTLVILDEVHHAGDSMSWGESVREAFEPAARRLALTGTPFRSDVNPIPFVTYAPGRDGISRSFADTTYGYGDALRDHVVRPVMFLAYSGRMRWRTKAGDEVAAVLGADQAKDVTQQAWRTALDPQGEWIPQVLRAADRRLTEVRKHVPDAGGLVIASDQTKARAYSKLLHGITGHKPTVVLSDDPKAGEKITAFGESNDRWMVAVRMVSEGVDVPRLMVGVYATSTSTPLFFAQAVGRFVRARKRGETASVFLPSVPLLLRLAGELEEERDHALGKRLDGTWSEEDILVAQALAERSTADLLVDDQLSFEALESEATFDRVLFDGGEFGTGVTPGTAEEEEFLGIPGLLDADQVHDLLRSARGTKKPAKDEPKAAAPVDVKALKKELASCVSAYARQTGTSQASVHADLRRMCGGPEVPRASAAELQARLDRIRAWAVGRR
ncbi:DEAD/DEAH box helicase [Longivirga aurantiaca]|uniref:DEAD/DEAH box helicase n=1 Tax=Longivirga aurantiaca TaxID=1837743 RepID=A0ABW1T4P3_9ACTN